MTRPAAFAFLLVAAPAFAQTPKWATYVAKADRFSVLMPGPTQIQRQETQGVTTNLYLSRALPYVCVVSKTNLPPTTKASDVAQLSAGLKRSMLATSHSTQTGEHPATYGGVSGDQIEFRSANGAGATWLARTPRAFYSVTIAKQGGVSPAEIKRFFASFRLQ